MAKSRDAFRTISEVAEWLDIQAHVLRFWESKFSQVKPVKRAGGRRYYRPQDMLLLGGIKKLLHDDGLTIKGAQKLLREEGIKYVSSLSHSLDETHGAEIDSSAASVEPAASASEDAPTEAADPSAAPLVDAPATAAESDSLEDIGSDVAPAETEAESVVATQTPDAAVVEPEAGAPVEDTARDPDEVLEDFLELLRRATHIHPAQANEANELVARFQTLFEAPQETIQA
ncbi:MerR family regulatory protein [Shimia sp. SK013]|uniref:MerR family transcriptional regulator n=1 Tax=Shimia sp. SK013 TaxID=1389006 RepID=UPI0006CD8D84|nr:MerR family transcriptional regulator [Shimia sp. SK013]KPA22870.1 MerR family regulatory protein [Shimia sp. SK013]